MGLLIFAVVVILLVAMAIWGIGYLPFPDPPKGVLYCLVVLIGIAAIAQRAGVI